MNINHTKMPTKFLSFILKSKHDYVPLNNKLSKNIYHNPEIHATLEGMYDIQNFVYIESNKPNLCQQGHNQYLWCH